MVYTIGSISILSVPTWSGERNYLPFAGGNLAQQQPNFEGDRNCQPVSANHGWASASSSSNNLFPSKR